jgi:DNA invertase Pin-like site-specific DNA recombinase
MFIEKASGKNADRPELKKMLSFVRSGDMLFMALRYFVWVTAMI